MPSNTRSKATGQNSDVTLLTDILAIKRTARNDPKRTACENPARKENHRPVNSAEIIEISSDEDEEPVAPKRPAVAASSKLRNLQDKIMQLEKENERIKKENEEMRKQQAVAADLEEQITCEVCSAKLWSPFILTCGHTFCQQDLENWFSTALRQHRNVYPHYNVNTIPVNVYGIFQQLPLPPYTCPKCRQSVRSKPIQNFAVKGLVRAVAGQSGETSPKKPADATNVWGQFFPAQ
ncbi:RING-type domain-containing protein [Mycena venus]|uniref:RING-type domain-containing protein n=1 Tax=Mycena venus TaxID=2733690 RepID=A0A8H6XN29_9AGAR|nr:RING-type domain-containing protein [Mycena venus]